MSNNNTKIKLNKKTQNVQLVEGVFNYSDAFQIINSLIEQKINFHKIKKLKQLEIDKNANVNFENNRIEELQKEKLTAKEHLLKAKNHNLNVVINGALNITIDN